MNLSTRSHYFIKIPKTFTITFKTLKITDNAVINALNLLALNEILFFRRLPVEEPPFGCLLSFFISFPPLKPQYSLKGFLPQRKFANFGIHLTFGRPRLPLGRRLLTRQDILRLCRLIFGAELRGHK